MWILERCRGAGRTLGVSHTALQFALRQDWAPRWRRRRAGAGRFGLAAVDTLSDGFVLRGRDRGQAPGGATSGADGGAGRGSGGVQASRSVSGVGVLLALPALLGEGLVETAEAVYGRLKNGLFGLRSVLLTLVFMALLRIRSTEQLKGHAPGELGLALGLDRAPR